MSVPKEAIIQAGGIGRRMGEITNRRPKWLAEVAKNMTIAHLQLNWLKTQGVEKVFVTISERYKNSYLPSDICWDMIQILWEPEPLGDEGGLKKALDYIEGDETIVLNCDVLTDLNLSLLPPSPALVMVHPRAPWGVLIGTIGFVEKPLLTELWVNAGIYRFSVSLKEELLDKGMIPEHVIPKLVTEGRMHLYYFEGKWLSVDTLKDIDEARCFLKYNL